MHGYSPAVEFSTLFCTHIFQSIKSIRILKYIFYEAFINYGRARMMFLSYSDESHCIDGLNFNTQKKKE